MSLKAAMICCNSVLGGGNFKNKLPPKPHRPAPWLVAYHPSVRDSPGLDTKRIGAFFDSSVAPLGAICSCSRPAIEQNKGKTRVRSSEEKTPHAVEARVLQATLQRELSRGRHHLCARLAPDPTRWLMPPRRERRRAR